MSGSKGMSIIFYGGNRRILIEICLNKLNLAIQELGHNANLIATFSDKKVLIYSGEKEGL